MTNPPAKSVISPSPTSGGLETTEPLIARIFTQMKPSQSIEFGRVGVEFIVRGKTITADATVTLHFTPKARLVFVVQVADPFAGISGANGPWKGDVRLTGRAVTVPMMIMGSRAFSGPEGSGCTLNLIPNRSVAKVTPPTADLRRVDFHLFNFPDFNSKNDYIMASTHDGAMKSSRRCGRVLLEADGWNITLAADDQTNDCRQQHEASGGYMITHMGRIERENGETFSTEQAEGCLTGIHSFLSFALGRWAGVALPVGYNANGDRVFEEWGMPRANLGMWNGSMSWFDEQHGEVLAEVFPGYWRLLHDERWQVPLRHAVYWYIRANAGGTGQGIDTGLIIAQVALELLAWQYCVRDQRFVSNDAFGPRGLSAANKLRLLARTMEIPVHLPGCMQQLPVPTGVKLADICDAIAMVRNNLVHPRENPIGWNDWDFPTWKAAMWLLELALLRLSGHAGEYRNRLRLGDVGGVEPVPWASRH